MDASKEKFVTSSTLCYFCLFFLKQTVTCREQPSRLSLLMSFIKLKFPIEHIKPSVHNVQNDIKAHRNLLDILAKQLRITNQEEWYQLAQSSWIKYGNKLLDQYNDSPYRVLSTLLPEYHTYDDSFHFLL